MVLRSGPPSRPRCLEFRLYNCMNVPVGRRALQLHTVSRTTPSFARPDAPHVSRDAAFIWNPRPPYTRMHADEMTPRSFISAR